MGAKNAIVEISQRAVAWERLDLKYIQTDRCQVTRPKPGDDGLLFENGRLTDVSPQAQFCFF